MLKNILLFKNDKLNYRIFLSFFVFRPFFKMHSYLFICNLYNLYAIIVKNYQKIIKIIFFL